ncbi:MAG: hypothetical protein J6A83_08680, partial [Clostridia bacterium]|nr:hypothetical protein [Clostridia bacterium]
MIFAMIPSIAVGATDAATVGASLDVAKVGKVADADTLKAEYAAAGWTEITSVGDFNTITTGNYYLSGDIEVQAGETLKAVYTGEIILDGCGYAIKYVDQDCSIFKAQIRGYDLYVKNLSIINAKVDEADETTDSVDCAGILFDNVDRCRPQIDNVYLSGELNVGENASHINYAGLLVGFIGKSSGNVSITNTVVEGTLTCAAANAAVGGMIGQSSIASGSSLNIENCIGNVDCFFTPTSKTDATAGTGGFVGKAARTVNIMSCTNNGNVYAPSCFGSFVGSAIATPAVTIDSCVNKGGVYATVADAPSCDEFVGYTVSGYTSTVNNSVNNGETKNVTLLGLDAGATAGWLSATDVDAEETRDVRFILALDAEAMKTATYTLTVTFTTSEGSISRSATKVTVFEGLIAGGVEYHATSGVVLCGLEITDVPETDWTSVTVAFDADVDTLDFSGSADKPAA